MSVTVNITQPPATPVVVDVTETASPVSVSVSAAAQPVSVNVEETLSPVSVDVTPPPATPVTVEVAVAEGPPGAAGDPGPPGANAQIQIITLAAYLALSPAAQMDGTWYVIPKT